MTSFKSWYLAIILTYIDLTRNQELAPSVGELNIDNQFELFFLIEMPQMQLKTPSPSDQKCQDLPLPLV